MSYSHHRSHHPQVQKTTRNGRDTEAAFCTRCGVSSFEPSASKRCMPNPHPALSPPEGPTHA